MIKFSPADVTRQSYANSVVVAKLKQRVCVCVMKWNKRSGNCCSSANMSSRELHVLRMQGQDASWSNKLQDTMIWFLINRIASDFKKYHRHCVVSTN